MSTAHSLALALAQGAAAPPEAVTSAHAKPRSCYFLQVCVRVGNHHNHTPVARRQPLDIDHVALPRPRADRRNLTKCHC